MESVCISYNLISFLESQLFSNLVSLLVAIGTIGTVIDALYLGLRKKKTRYKFSWAFSFLIQFFLLRELLGQRFNLNS